VPDGEPGIPRLLKGSEVAVLLRVGPRTVTRYAEAKVIGSCRTPGGHRRYYEAEIRALAAGQRWEGQVTPAA
jgi:excisionase family DNA binding protein